jgi:hypothetical protein
MVNSNRAASIVKIESKQSEIRNSLTNPNTIKSPVSRQKVALDIVSYSEDLAHSRGLYFTHEAIVDLKKLIESGLETASKENEKSNNNSQQISEQVQERSHGDNYALAIATTFLVGSIVLLFPYYLLKLLEHLFGFDPLNLHQMIGAGYLVQEYDHYILGILFVSALCVSILCLRRREGAVSEHTLSESRYVTIIADYTRVLDLILEETFRQVTSGVQIGVYHLRAALKSLCPGAWPFC